MQRIALLVEYSGKKFHGSQLQEGVATVQQELERAIAVLAKQPCRIALSGRTDAGVHASGQVAHVDVPDDFFVDLKDLSWRLNGIMRADLAVVNLKVVPSDFHARYSAVKREYVYRILNRPQRSAILKDTHLHVRQPLDLKAMSDAASRLLGQHDFSAFRSLNRENANPECLVSHSQLLNLREGVLEYKIAANHFVYNMVRIIVGTLIEVGLAKRDASSVSEALQTGDRKLTGPTAPPWGLTLSEVSYPDEYRMSELMNPEMSK
jgi:tRNA pseudouridine38-40 synthase